MFFNSCVLRRKKKKQERDMLIAWGRSDFVLKGADLRTASFLFAFQLPFQDQ